MNLQIQSLKDIGVFLGLVAIFTLPLLESFAAAEPPSSAEQRLLKGDFQWTTSAPLLSPTLRTNDPCFSVKDPSIVRFENRWHLFCTIRSQKRSHQIEYLSFDDLPDARRAERHILTITDGYFCAPQVFYFTPHRRWYLIHQIIYPA